MRAENIEVTFKIPIPVDKPDLNGVIYSKDAIKNAYKNVKNVPIEIPNDAFFRCVFCWRRTFLLPIYYLIERDIHWERIIRIKIIKVQQMLSVS